MLAVYCLSSWFIYQKLKPYLSLCILCGLTHLSWFQGLKYNPTSYWPRVTERTDLSLSDLDSPISGGHWKKTASKKNNGKEIKMGKYGRKEEEKMWLKIFKIQDEFVCFQGKEICGYLFCSVLPFEGWRYGWMGRKAITESALIALWHGTILLANNFSSEMRT